MSSKKYNRDDAFFNGCLDSPRKFKVIVEFILDADDHESAQAKIHELVKEGILAMASDDEKDIGYSYDISDCEVAEIDI